ncbi:CPBP family intramembrane glutamic endopeptidase [Propionibacteriaceae bacterium Y2011]
MSPTSRKRKKKGGAPPRRPPVRQQAPAAPTRSGVLRRIADQLPLLPVTDGLRHPVAQRHPDRLGLRIILGIVMAIMTYLVLVPTVAQLVLGLTYRIVTPDLAYEDYYASAMAGERPEGLLATNLGIGSFIVICLVLMRWVNLAPPGLVVSVVRRIRWRYLIASGGVALLVFCIVQAATLLPAGTTITPQPGFAMFLLVVLLTSPLQAAAEEVFFRGYLQQSLGSLVGAWWFGVVGSSVLFALAHGLQSPALFVDRLAFGLVVGLLVWRTGGLEAAIGTHVINNVLAFTLAGLTSTIAEVRGITEIGWGRAAFDVLTFTVIAGGCWLVASRMNLVTRTGHASLVDRSPIQ